MLLCPQANSQHVDSCLYLQLCKSHHCHSLRPIHPYLIAHLTNSNYKMSYYFCIVGTKDNPLFEHEFGTSKQGGDGIARFRDEARHMNPFIVHSSLDIVEEVQWANGAMYAPFSFSILPSPHFHLLYYPYPLHPPTALSSLLYILHTSPPPHLLTPSL